MCGLAEPVLGRVAIEHLAEEERVARRDESGAVCGWAARVRGSGGNWCTQGGRCALLIRSLVDCEPPPIVPSRRCCESE